MPHPIAIFFCVVVGLLMLPGCGGPSARFDKATLTYEQLPLKRSLDAKTYELVQAGETAIEFDSLKIDGMQRVSAAPALRITVTTGKASVGETVVSSDVQLAYNASIIGTDGKDYDMTRSAHFEKFGYREQMAENAQVVATHFATTSYGLPCRMVVVDTASGKQVAAEEVDGSGAVSLGAERSLIHMTSTLATFSGTSTSDNDAGVYEERFPIFSGWGPLRVAKAGEADYRQRLSSGADSPRRAELRQRCAAQGRAQLAAAPGLVRSQIASTLDLSFATGPRNLSCEFGVFKDDKAFAAVATGFTSLCSETDTARRNALADDLLARLDLFRTVKGITPRELAMLTYDQTLVQLAAGRLDEAQVLAKQAHATNASESDGLFSSSGKELEARLVMLDHHLLDRQRRALAQH